VAEEYLKQEQKPESERRAEPEDKREEETKDDKDTTPPPPQPAKIAGIQWAGAVPSQKWMNFYTKVLSRFAGGAGLKLTVQVEVSPADGISRSAIDETRNALRELGLEEKITEV
jgi:hypothetical protein